MIVKVVGSVAYWGWGGFGWNELVNELYHGNSIEEVAAKATSLVKPAPGGNSESDFNFEVVEVL